MNSIIRLRVSVSLAAFVCRERVRREGEAKETGQRREGETKETRSKEDKARATISAQASLLYRDKKHYSKVKKKKNSLNCDENHNNEPSALNSDWSEEQEEVVVVGNESPS